jgi:ribosomal protein L7Ae-like RNA K-turn-binding protein
LFKNPENIEKILLLLCHKMGLTYENDIHKFVPSRTYLGKKISQDFIATLLGRIVNIDSDAAMGKVLKTILTKKTK